MPSSATPAPSVHLDCTALQRWQRLAPASSPWLHEEVGRRMQEKLDWIVRTPQNWCDWEAVRGGTAAHDLVAARYPKSAVWIVQQQPGHHTAARALWHHSRWARLMGHKAAVHWDTPQPASLDMVWANMALHQTLEPMALLDQWAQWLRADGFVMFSCLGPDTLAQLRTLYARMGWPPCTQDFVDMHNWGDMLLNHGFAEPVMDMEHLHLQYSSPERLLQELRELGRNLHPARFAGLRGRHWYRQLHEGLASLADAQGRITMTFEIVYGHAFKAPPRMKMQAHTHISLADMRQALKERPQNKSK